MAKAAAVKNVPVVIEHAPVPATIQEAMKRELEEMSARTSAPSGDRIRLTQDKKFVLPDGTKSAGPLTLVIVDFVSGNEYYDRPYAKGEESVPACFAIGVEVSSLAPSKNSPVKQTDDNCAKCPNNQWGSDGDKGKACTNTRLLAVMEPSGEADSPIYILKVSKTAIKGFDAYVQTLKNTLQLPPVGVVTEVYFDANLTYGSLRFGNPTPNPYIENAFGKRAQARARLLQEPDVSGYAPPKKKAAGKR